MKKGKRAKNGKSIALGRGVLLLLVLSFGCATPSRHELCSSSLPGLEESTQDALLALAPWIEQNSEGRALASDSPNREVVLLGPSDRAYWRAWAETRLFAVQRSMDLTDSERRGTLRKCLSALANELVTFHGYATQGRADRMEKSLHKITVLSMQSRKEGCP